MPPRMLPGEQVVSYCQLYSWLETRWEDKKDGEGVVILSERSQEPRRVLVYRCKSCSETARGGNWRNWMMAGAATRKTRFVEHAAAKHVKLPAASPSESAAPSESSAPSEPSASSALLAPLVSDSFKTADIILPSGPSEGEEES